MKICLYIINKFLFFLTRILFRRNSHPKKILILRTGSLGDSICAMPAISLIRQNFPNAKISFLTETGRENLVSLAKLLNNELFDEFIYIRDFKQSELTKLLKQYEYDLIIELVQNTSSLKKLIRNIIYFRVIIGVKSGFGWQISKLPYLKHFQVAEKSERDALISHISPYLDISFPLNYDYAITKEDIIHVNQILPYERSKYICLVIGAKREMNRWPIENFEEIVKAFPSEQFIVIGGVDDVQISKGLINYTNVISLCNKLTPIQSGLVLSHSKFCLSNDTGPMHLAYSFGAKVIALFSNRDYPKIWFPPQKPGNVTMRATEIACTLCLKESCHMDNLCMKAIKPEHVIDEMNLILNEK
jgi:ADP-heptose:LPS heptosyltransferase